MATTMVYYRLAHYNEPFEEEMEWVLDDRSLVARVSAGDGKV